MIKSTPIIHGTLKQLTQISLLWFMEMTQNVKVLYSQYLCIIYIMQTL